MSSNWYWVHFLQTTNDISATQDLHGFSGGPAMCCNAHCNTSTKAAQDSPSQCNAFQACLQFEHSSFDFTNMMLMHSMTPFSAFHESACEACLTQGDVLGRSQQDQIPGTLWNAHVISLNGLNILVVRQPHLQSTAKGRCLRISCKGSSRGRASPANPPLARCSRRSFGEGTAQLWLDGFKGQPDSQRLWKRL